MLVEWIAKQ